jgi:mutator protein MutT
MKRAPLIVAAAVLQKEGLVLIARRRPGGPRGGLWEFPGGKIEAGETAPVALRRELREELGIDTDIGECLLETEHAYPDLTVRLIVHRAIVRSGDPQPLDHDELRWVTTAELDRFAVVAGDQAIIDELKRRENRD